MSLQARHTLQITINNQMRKQIKNAILYIVCIIAYAFLFGTAITYSEYSSEKLAAKIFKEQRLDTLSKEDARYWVNWSVVNSNTTKWYLHKMINHGSAPDTIPFWGESDYLNY